LSDDRGPGTGSEQNFPDPAAAFGAWSHDGDPHAGDHERGDKALVAVKPPNRSKYGPMPSAHARIAALTFGLCAAPYLGIRLYLAAEMHEPTVEVALPDARVLSGLFVLGVIVPAAGVIWTVRWVLRDGLQFRLAGLLEAYGALIILFASSYALIQVGGIESRFTGMPAVWAADDPQTLEVHVERLHELFFESLYLSVMTITTVGFGDLAPITRIGRALTAIEGLAGIGFVGIALGHYFSVCLHRREPGGPGEPAPKA
jgi:voltage-gated potassium channel Kch